jgi:hypothetical protein
MKFDVLTEDNILLFAIKHYEKPQCVSRAEFDSDMKRFSYIKRLLKKYKAGERYKERLLLNHIIVLINLFGVDGATTLLMFKTDRYYWGTLKSLFIFLNVLIEGELGGVEEDLEMIDILGKL